MIALVGCGESGPHTPKSKPEIVKPSAKTKAQIEAENKAFAETKAKAEAGDAEAQFNLGVMYDEGEGVPKDDKEAVKWWQKAADQGNAKTQVNLGGMYEKGQGVGQDFKEAFKWYQTAADQGFVNAQYNLGVMYDNGQGVEQDYMTTYAWWNIAATNGDQDAKKNALPRFAKKMTPSQIAKAEALSKEMVKKNPKLIKE